MGAAEKRKKMEQLHHQQQNGELSKQDMATMLSLEQELQDVDAVIHLGLPDISDEIYDGKSIPMDVEEEEDHAITKTQQACLGFFSKYGSIVGKVTLYLMFLGYTIFLICAVIYDANAAIAILVLTGLVIFGKLYAAFRNRYGAMIYENYLRPIEEVWDNYFHITKW